MALLYNPFTSLILTSEQKLTKPLYTIARLTGIKATHCLEALVHETQNKWLRKIGTERWQMDDRYSSQTKVLLPLFHELAMYESLLPIHATYTYALLLGSTAKCITAQLNFLKAIKNTLFIEKLVCLTGDRPLTEQEKEYLDTLHFSSCLTETDMIIAHLEHEIFRIAFSDITISIINTPFKLCGNSMQRPTTADTIIYWLTETQPSSGSCLALSSQPCITYQDSVLRTLLPDTFTLETVGPRDPYQSTTSLYLDTLARWLYQEQQRLKLLKCYF